MKVFLDVGAFRGETLKVALHPEFGFDKLYSFEPCSVPYEKLLTDYGQDPRVTHLHFGLWDETGPFKLYGAGTSGGSVFPDKPTFTESGEAAHHIYEMCEFVRASDWFQDNVRDEDENWLKLNCEGAECDILDDLRSTGEIDKVDVLAVAWDAEKVPSECFHKETTRREILKYARDTNCLRIYEMTDESWLRDLLQGKLGGIPK